MSLYNCTRFDDYIDKSESVRVVEDAIFFIILKIPCPNGEISSNVFKSNLGNFRVFCLNSSISTNETSLFVTGTTITYIVAVLNVACGTDKVSGSVSAIHPCPLPLPDSM
jgi:hypothetical protein